LDLAWRREVLKTSVWVLLSMAVTGREGFNGNRNQQNYRSTMEHGKVKLGRRSCFRSVENFGKWIEWLLTGKVRQACRCEGPCHERGEKERGAAVLFAISKEFGKSVDWLLTGKAFVEPKKRVTKDPTEL
jgi:hypothetical protein